MKTPSVSNTKQMLVVSAVLVEADWESDEGWKRIEAVSNVLQASVIQAFESQRDCYPTGVISFHRLGEDEQNAARCFYCGRWATNHALPDQIDGIHIGVTINGRFMCDWCRCKHHPQESFE